MTIIASRQRRRKDSIVNIMLNGGRVTSGFRAALFAAASRAGTSVNEYVLQAAAEKLHASGAEFSGAFEPGDLQSTLAKAETLIKTNTFQHGKDREVSQHGNDI
ncbi:hypothetical protein [Sinorhizobium americanum]|uniref:DUF1778 domain-containing protein n=1 Tax=Sinorhizobium americanum TaxID=194963 RepID=A0A4R2BRS3_9HYPH|nr:hypothetical protein [Sinorhizobium americanum]TCN30136.1 hypothetical protein EV184_1082 [Sinorhizobium americanum]